MCISEYDKKIFGVALDPADDPWTLELKQEWMAADHQQWLAGEDVDLALSSYPLGVTRLNLSLLQCHKRE